ncbi:MAG: hypothetical protein WBN68_02465, partial [Sedimenticolaceae bacterium]
MSSFAIALFAVMGPLVGNLIGVRTFKLPANPWPLKGSASPLTPDPRLCETRIHPKKDFIAAIATGMHPFMVSYGFEDFARLTGKI